MSEIPNKHIRKLPSERSFLKCGITMSKVKSFEEKLKTGGMVSETKKSKKVKNTEGNWFEKFNQ